MKNAVLSTGVLDPISNRFGSLHKRLFLYEAIRPLTTVQQKSFHHNRFGNIYLISKLYLRLSKRFSIARLNIISKRWKPIMKKWCLGICPSSAKQIHPGSSPTSSGSTSLNSRPLPVHVMTCWLLGSCSIETRNCHNCKLPRLPL